MIQHSIKIKIIFICNINAPNSHDLGTTWVTTARCQYHIKAARLLYKPLTTSVNFQPRNNTHTTDQQPLESIGAT